ncbi:MAG: hypothetical protein DHS20C21_09300 [Gemmatimonadota bacterium]|nr:MAG: hypothetical protein DHS20C21_09300 [Gemmatimonadota bacterium]
MSVCEARLGAALVAAWMFGGCSSSVSDVEKAPVEDGSPPIIVRSVTHSLGAFGVVASVGTEGLTFELSMQFPQERVYVFGGLEGDGEELEHIYPDPLVTAPNGASDDVAFVHLGHLWDDSEVEFAVLTDDGVNVTKWRGGTSLWVSGTEIPRTELVRAVDALLQADGPIVCAVVPAVRMEQYFEGQWHNLRHYAADSFLHFVAPMDESRVRVTIVPLLAQYYSDRIEITALPDEAASGIEFEIGEGFEGVPAPLDELAGKRLLAGKPIEVPFPDPRSLFTADLTVLALVPRDVGPPRVPRALVGGRCDWDVFDSRLPRPTLIAPPGSELYQELTYRSRGLAELLRHGEVAPWYPPSDDEFPEWVRDHFGN